jgi:dolichyl-diphosphooligosaccharide--protein glycosyltransferase
MEMPNANSTFTYTQRAETNADGEFTMTVPYASTGGGNWGPNDGYTNTSVRATGPYQFESQQFAQVNGSVEMSYYNATGQVTEAQVIGEDDSSIEVTLSEAELPEQNGTDGGTEDTSSSDGTGTENQSLEPTIDVINSERLAKARLTG